MKSRIKRSLSKSELSRDSTRGAAAGCCKSATAQPSDATAAQIETATNAVFSVTVKEGDVTGTLTSVADSDLLGTELLAGVAAAATRTSGTSKNVVKRVGYRGNKRYVQANIKSTITAATIISCEALLHSPHVMPTANP